MRLIIQDNQKDAGRWAAEYIVKRINEKEAAGGANIHRARKNHKLSEWHVVCHWIEELPYAKELILFE